MGRHRLFAICSNAADLDRGFPGISGGSRCPVSDSRSEGAATDPFPAGQAPTGIVLLAIARLNPLRDEPHNGLVCI